MKYLFSIVITSMMIFGSCKNDPILPSPLPVDSKLFGYWHNYDHFTYNSVLDTTFSDTNMFIMMDLDIHDTLNLTKYYRDGSSPRPHTYDTTTARMNIYAGTFRVTYKMEFNGEDSMTLSSLPRPQGGIPFPGSDKEIWVFVRR